MDYGYANKVLKAELRDFLEPLCRDVLGESDIEKPFSSAFELLADAMGGKRSRQEE